MQLEFLWRDHATFEADLAERTGGPIHVVLTDNSSTIMTYKGRSNDSPPLLRIHRMFLAADSSVLEALSTWVTKRQSKKANQVLDTFIRANEHYIQSRGARLPKLITMGKCFNLLELYDSVNARHFENTINTPITWGKTPGRRRRTSIRMGSFTPEDNLIRIHPYLDQPFVPRYFVRYVVFHEMLHAHLGVEISPTGRQRIHTPKFNRMEQAYPDYERAIAWHDNPKNLGRLLKATPAVR